MGITEMITQLDSGAIIVLSAIFLLGVIAVGKFIFDFFKKLMTNQFDNNQKYNDLGFDTIKKELDENKDGKKEADVESVKKKLLNPRYHQIFQKIRYEINNRVPYLDLKKNGKLLPVKSMLIRDMLKIKFTYWKAYLFSFVNDEKLYYLESYQVRDLFLKKTYKIIKKYEEKWKEIGINLIIIKKFSKWHSERVAMFVEAIESIFNGNSYSSNEEKINACLDLFIALIHMSIILAEETLQNLNGQISGKTYKGKIIE